jgi:hypothetical protein
MIEIAWYVYVLRDAAGPGEKPLSIHQWKGGQAIG